MCSARFWPRHIHFVRHEKKMNNVAGLFDPGGPATVARAKRMCNSLGRSPSFSNKECTPISQIFVKNGQFSNKECVPISLIYVENA